MRLDYTLSAALMGASIVIIQAQVAVALSTLQIRQIAKEITIRIEDIDGSSGSGVILKQNGDTYYVVTNVHVIKDKSNYTIITPDRQRYPINYSSIKKGGLVDLAVLKFTSKKSYKTAKFGNANLLQISTPTYISGFTKNNLGYEFRFRSGEVIANSSQIYDYSLVYTNNTLGGMSGGAVLNQNGELVAINGWGQTSGFYNHSETIITGAARGITINTILKLGLVDLDPNIPLETTSINPQADDFYRLGLNKEETSNYQEAIAAYDEAIRLKPKYGYAYFKRGYNYYQLADYPAALTNFQQAESFGIKHADLYNYRGVVRDELKDYKGAISDFNEAIKLDPKYHYAYSNRADVYQKLNQYPEAIKDYTEAIRLNDGNASLYISRGNAYYDSYQDPEKALVDYTKAIIIDENSSVGYYNRGNIYRRLGQYNRAISDYNKAINLKYDYADAYYNRGLTWNNLNDYSKAVEDFTRYIYLNPENRSGYSNRADNYKKLQLYYIAIQDYTKAIELNSESTLHYHDRAEVYYEIGKLDAAIADWRIDRKAFPADWNAYTDLAIAVALYHQGKKAEAIELAKSAIQKRDNLTNWNTIRSFGWGDRLLEDTQYFFQDATVKASIPNNLPRIAKKRPTNNFTLLPPIKPSRNQRRVIRVRKSKLNVPTLSPKIPLPPSTKFPSTNIPPLPTIRFTPNPIKPRN
jgi:tetratricopeptide (TPR) repeat protein